MYRHLLIFSMALALPVAPALAEVRVTHTVEGRFGVSYVSLSDGTGRTQPMYEGRYTTTFAHQADNGLRFRFDLGVVVGNIGNERGLRQPTASVQTDNFRN